MSVVPALKPLEAASIAASAYFTLAGWDEFTAKKKATAKKEATGQEDKSDGYFLGLVFEMPAPPKDDELIEHITGLAHDCWELGGEFAYVQAITYDRFLSKILTAKG